MTVAEVADRLGLRVLTPGAAGEREVTGGYTSDLLSDVIAHARSGNIWITLQTHQNVLAVAKLKDLAAVIIVNGRQPDRETLHRAERENVVVLGTDASAFRISAELWGTVSGNSSFPSRT
jgi:hypothetical protein